MKLHEALSKVVSSGALKSFKIKHFDENGVEGQRSKFCNSEQLLLEFPNGQKVEIGIESSGVSENTEFFLVNK